MTRVVFMCGPAGSGKSTIARELESGGMARLSFDEEAWVRGIQSQPLDEEVRLEIESHLRQRLLDLVMEQADVVLDYSFWSRRMREDYRAILRPLGIDPETIYLATPRKVALARVHARAGHEPNEVQLPDELAAAYFDHFEVPTPDEGPLTVVAEARRFHPRAGGERSRPGTSAIHATVKASPFLGSQVPPLT